MPHVDDPYRFAKVLTDFCDTTEPAQLTADHWRPLLERPEVSAERLSALDASFLAVETPDSPMHVGWVGVYDPPEDGPSPTFAELFEHLAGRLEHAPRYRQRLAAVPFGLHEPVWVDDPGLRSRGAPPAGGRRRPRRDRRRRPLHPARARPPAVGDVDRGLAARRRALRSSARRTTAWSTAPRSSSSASCCSTPARRPAGGRERRTWTPAPAPSAGERLARAVADRAADGATLALTPMRLAGRLPRAARPREPQRPHARAHPAPARAELAAEPPWLAPPPPRSRHAPARRAARDPPALRREPQRRRARRLRRRAAALRRASRREPRSG